jgi:uncharacterized protein YebE (UPF0316 family)
MDFDQVYALIIIPLFIFLARVSDVSIGTIRIVFVSKGLKYLAPILGFFEVFIWLLAMSKVMSNLDNIIYYVAYAGGFATGNYIGLLIEERLAIGFVNLRIITQKDGSQLIKHLSSEGYGVTQIEAHGSQGQVHIIYCIIKRTEYKQIVQIISMHNPNAFYTIEDIRFINKGVHPNKSDMKRPRNLSLLRWRLGK